MKNKFQKLIILNSWLEYKRYKTKFLLLGALLVGCLFLLNIEFSAASLIQNTTPPHESLKPVDPIAALSFDNILSLGYSGSVGLLTLILGYLLCFSMLFRDRSDWEQGQYQMIRISSHSFLSMELSRFVIYLALISIYTLITIAFTLISIKQSSTLGPYHISILIGWSLYHFALIVPITLSWGLCINNLNFSFNTENHEKARKLTIMLGTLGLIKILMHFRAYLIKHSAFILSPLNLGSTSETPSGLGQTILPWEPLILTTTLAALILVTAAKIAQETES